MLNQSTRRHYCVLSLLGSRVWPFRVMWWHQSRDHSIPHRPFSIGGTLERSLYLQPFSRYRALSALVSRVWPFWVTWLHRKNCFPMQLIIKQQTGKKRWSETFKIMCSFCAVHALPIWYTLIRQVAALRHVKNWNIDYYTLVFAHYLWLCSRWNFCNRSTLCENIL